MIDFSSSQTSISGSLGITLPNAVTVVLFNVEAGSCIHWLKRTEDMLLQASSTFVDKPDI